METCCRLCRSENVPLKESHIVSKMFYNVIKKKSPTGIMRQVTDPNKGIQDGIKLPFLCDECEELFSKYETYFSNNIYTKTICSFLAYLILRYAFFYDDTPIIRLIANCVWPIIAVLGYTIGYKNYTSENLSAIARVYLTFIVPFFVYNVFLSFTLTYDTDEFAKDAFFICLIFLYIFYFSD